MQVADAPRSKSAPDGSRLRAASSGYPAARVQTAASAWSTPEQHRTRDRTGSSSSAARPWQAGSSERSEDRIGRSLTAYGDAEFSRYLRRAFLAGAGFDAEDLSTVRSSALPTVSSDYNPCHKLMPSVVENVRRGVLQGGALPMVFPDDGPARELRVADVDALRNLPSMTPEELIRAQPMDAVVFLGGCDKTVPAHLMGAAADVPAILAVVGPMLTGAWRGRASRRLHRLPALLGRHRGGELDSGRSVRSEGPLTPAGTCMVMGTASTMASWPRRWACRCRAAATPPAPRARGCRTRGRRTACGRAGARRSVRPTC